ncbi:MAG TPA: efflux RND transporter periplasmic adaptor subunit [Gemmatimonadales bacterium]|nr:efflux RND transporter periplasmic adaptor subunit [Gemmatimonadales bacterium]
MSRRHSIGSFVLLVAVVGTLGSLAAWKYTSIQEANAASANQPEPTEAVTVAVAREREHRRTTTSIGTVLALRSVTLRNELPGTVRQVALTPGQVVDMGTLLVALDVSVEEAELKAKEAEAALAETVLGRLERLIRDRAAPQVDVDRARAQRDVALAEIERTKAIIARKTIRAPFRARVGIADVHPGQYLNEGTQLTTLQGVADAVHVDFAVAQRVAAGLRKGDSVGVFTSSDASPVAAQIVAIDARVDPTTRNAMVRARIVGAAAHAAAPGASVRVLVPVGPPSTAVVVPVSALRKGPGGDHVFVIAPDQDGNSRAHLRQVESGPVLGDDVLILAGLSAGEQVAASGSFKLREAVLVAVAGDPPAGANGAK